MTVLLAGNADDAARTRIERTGARVGHTIVERTGGNEGSRWRDVEETSRIGRAFQRVTGGGTSITHLVRAVIWPNHRGSIDLFIQPIVTQVDGRRTRHGASAERGAGINVDLRRTNPRA